MKRIHICFVLAALMAPAAIAQNVDATVEVNRTYESALKLTPKPVLAMAVPDSLLKFDLDFDYSVFDRPYKGSVNYRPYLLDFRPQPDAYRGKNLYLKAGLGYTLHPELDFVYSPEVGNNSSVNIYAHHKSYFGKYKYRKEDLKNYRQEMAGQGLSQTLDLEEHKALYLQDSEWTGYDSYSVIGANGTVGLSFGQFFYDAQFKGIQGKDGSYTTLTGIDDITSSFTNLKALAGLRGAVDDRFDYSGAFSVGLGAENASSLDKNINFYSLGFDGKFGMAMDEDRLEMSVHFNNNFYSGLGKATVGDWYVQPGFVSISDDVKFKLGIKVGFTFKSDNNWMGNKYDPVKGQGVYPDVYLSYIFVPDKAEFFASLTGGNGFSSYQTIKERDHLALPASTENTVEHYNLKAGLRGNANPALRYDISLGFRRVSNAVMYEFYAPNKRRVSYQDIKEPYVRANVVYDKKPLYIEGNLLFRATSFDVEIPEVAGVRQGVFGPRHLVADIKALYYWKSRICGGITASMASKSDFRGVKGNSTTYTKGYLNGYVDLGLYGEYALDRKLSVYARLGNLLNARIYDSTLVPVSGTYATFGIILNM